MIIHTGFGYFVKNGLKIEKYILPVGSHPDLPIGVTAVEVSNQAALDAIILDDIPLTPEQKKANLISQLNQIDFQSVRSLRAITNGTAVQDDHDKLASLESQAQGIRSQLSNL